MVAKLLKYQGELYEYSHAKGNILVYVSQPYQYYEDWASDGGILIVKYRPNVKFQEYLVLHKMVINVYTAKIEHVDISKDDKIAKCYVEE